MASFTMKTAHPNIGGWLVSSRSLLWGLVVGFEAFLKVRSVCNLDLESWNCRVDTVDMFRTAEPKTSPPWMRSETPPGCQDAKKLWDSEGYLVGGFNPPEKY